MAASQSCYRKRRGGGKVKGQVQLGRAATPSLAEVAASATAPLPNPSGASGRSVAMHRRPMGAAGLASSASAGVANPTEVSSAPYINPQDVDFSQVYHFQNPREAALVRGVQAMQEAGKPLSELQQARFNEVIARNPQALRPEALARMSYSELGYLSPVLVAQGGSRYDVYREPETDKWVVCREGRHVLSGINGDGGHCLLHPHAASCAEREMLRLAEGGLARCTCGRWYNVEMGCQNPAHNEAGDALASARQHEEDYHTMVAAIARRTTLTEEDIDALRGDDDGDAEAAAASLPATTALIVPQFTNAGAAAAWLTANPEAGQGWQWQSEMPNGVYYTAIVTYQPQPAAQVTGAAAYFFRGPLALGGEFSVVATPDAVGERGRVYILDTDLTKSSRDDPEAVLAGGELEDYLRHGTPVRTTNRAGADTRGTRAVDGIGSGFHVVYSSGITATQAEGVVSETTPTRDAHVVAEPTIAESASRSAANVIAPADAAASADARSESPVPLTASPSVGGITALYAAPDNVNFAELTILHDGEAGFLRGVAAANAEGRSISPRQQAWLNKIVRRNTVARLIARYHADPDDTSALKGVAAYGIYNRDSATVMQEDLRRADSSYGFSMLVSGIANPNIAAELTAMDAGDAWARQAAAAVRVARNQPITAASRYRCVCGWWKPPIAACQNPVHQQPAPPAAQAVNAGQVEADPLANARASFIARLRSPERINTVNRQLNTNMYGTPLVRVGLGEHISRAQLLEQAALRPDSYIAGTGRHRYLHVEQGAEQLDLPIEGEDVRYFVHCRQLLAGPPAPTPRPQRVRATSAPPPAPATSASPATPPTLVPAAATNATLEEWLTQFPVQQVDLAARLNGATTRAAQATFAAPAVASLGQLIEHAARSGDVQLVRWGGQSYLASGAALVPVSADEASYFAYCRARQPQAAPAPTTPPPSPPAESTPLERTAVTVAQIPAPEFRIEQEQHSGDGRSMSLTARVIVGGGAAQNYTATTQSSGVVWVRGPNGAAYGIALDGADMGVYVDVDNGFGVYEGIRRYDTPQAAVGQLYAQRGGMVLVDRADQHRAIAENAARAGLLAPLGVELAGERRFNVWLHPATGAATVNRYHRRDGLPPTVASRNYTVSAAGRCSCGQAACEHGQAAAAAAQSPARARCGQCGRYYDVELGCQNVHSGPQATPGPRMVAPTNALDQYLSSRYRLGSQARLGAVNQLNRRFQTFQALPKEMQGARSVAEAVATAAALLGTEVRDNGAGYHLSVPIAAGRAALIYFVGAAGRDYFAYCREHLQVADGVAADDTPATSAIKAQVARELREAEQETTATTAGRRIHGLRVSSSWRNEAAYDPASRRLYAGQPRVTVHDSAAVDRLARSLFGTELNAADYGELVGAPAGASCTVSAVGEYISIETKLNDLGMSQTRSITRIDGELVINNNYFRLSGRAPEGTGIRIFARQVRACQRLGIRRMNVGAAGYPGDTQYNGYYTWARFGYNADLDSDRLPEQLRHYTGPDGQRHAVRTLNELMIYHKDDGAAWWKAHGHSFGGLFDLDPDSDSMKILAEYMEKKGVVI